jgi:hypothetical protein
VGRQRCAFYLGECIADQAGQRGPQRLAVAQCAEQAPDVARVVRFCDGNAKGARPGDEGSALFWALLCLGLLVASEFLPRLRTSLATGRLRWRGAL